MKFLYHIFVSTLVLCNIQAAQQNHKHTPDRKAQAAIVNYMKHYDHDVEIDCCQKYCCEIPFAWCYKLFVWVASSKGTPSDALIMGHKSGNVPDKKKS